MSVMRFSIPRDIIYGENALDHLSQLKGHKAMLVTGGSSMKRLGFLDQAEKLLQQAGMQTATVDGEINVKVGDQTFTDLVTLKGYLNDINTALGNKTESLNTENGINNRIKELKALRAEAVLGSQEWKDYDNQITKLEGKLPKTHKAT